jgi:hypothetical protein
MQSEPGIQRDGTRLAQTQYVSGRWTRFYQKLPRKMMGYREQVRNLNGIVRAMDVQTYNGYSYVHAGQQNVLQRYAIEVASGLSSGLIDRTPIAFPGNDNNNWQFSIMYDTANDANLFFAHAVPNIADISNTVSNSIYYGAVQSTAALLELTATVPADIAKVSGGIISLWPYLVRFGNDGFVGWSMPGQPLTTSGSGSGTARPCGNKIVRALPLRGTQGPACLMWSLDSLVRMQFVGGLPIWQFDSITTSSAILSSNGVIEHEGVYYWATVSGFALFNGVMRTLKNDDNTQFFLDNLNYAMRQKVFAMKVPRWGEIWWCAPLFGATECNWAIIYNYNEGYWYDTPLPAMGRSAGLYEQIYNYPIMSASTPNTDGVGYSMWQHEFGFDEVSGAVPISRAIKAFIQTNEFNIVVPKQIGSQGIDRAQSFSLLEPDFNQVGDLELQIWSRQNARAEQHMTQELVIPANPDKNQELVKLKHTGRLNSFMIISNTIKGNFIFGSPVIHWTTSDARRQD